MACLECGGYHLSKESCLPGVEICPCCDDGWITEDDTWVVCARCGKNPICHDCQESCDTPGCMEPICKDCDNEAFTRGGKSLCGECWKAA